MSKSLRDKIIDEAAARIEAAPTYEEKVYEYKRGVTELLLRTPYLEILSHPERYFVPGAKVKVSGSSYTRRGEPAPEGVGTILEVQREEGKVTKYLVKFDGPRWSSVWLPDWSEADRRDRYSELVEGLKEHYGPDNVWDRCECDIFVRCPQQWVPANYSDFYALAPGMEWPEYIIH